MDSNGPNKLHHHRVWKWLQKKECDKNRLPCASSSSSNNKYCRRRGTSQCLQDAQLLLPSRKAASTPGCNLNLALSNWWCWIYNVHLCGCLKLWSSTTECRLLSRNHTWESNYMCFHRYRGPSLDFPIRTETRKWGSDLLRFPWHSMVWVTSNICWFFCQLRWWVPRNC